MADSMSRPCRGPRTPARTIQDLHYHKHNLEAALKRLQLQNVSLKIKHELLQQLCTIAAAGVRVLQAMGVAAPASSRNQGVAGGHQTAGYEPHLQQAVLPHGVESVAHDSPEQAALIPSAPLSACFGGGLRLSHVVYAMQLMQQQPAMCRALGNLPAHETADRMAKFWGRLEVIFRAWEEHQPGRQPPALMAAIASHGTSGGSSSRRSSNSSFSSSSSSKDVSTSPNCRRGSIQQQQQQAGQVQHVWRAQAEEGRDDCQQQLSAADAADPGSPTSSSVTAASSSNPSQSERGCLPTAVMPGLLLPCWGGAAGAAAEAAAAAVTAAAAAAVEDAASGGGCPAAMVAAAAGANAALQALHQQELQLLDSAAGVQQLVAATVIKWVTVAVAQMFMAPDLLGAGAQVMMQRAGGPPSQKKLRQVVAVLQMSPEQFESIALGWKAFGELTTPMVAARDEVQQEVLSLLATMQGQQLGLQQHTHQHHQQQQAQAEGDDQEQPSMEQLMERGASVSGQRQTSSSSRGVAVANQQHMSPSGPAGPDSFLSQCTPARSDSPAVPSAAAVNADPGEELHGLLRRLVGRLAALHRCLGWLDHLQGQLLMGALNTEQVARFILALSPHPPLFRLVGQCMVQLWDAQQADEYTTTSGPAAAAAAARGGTSGPPAQQWQAAAAGPATGLSLQPGLQAWPPQNHQACTAAQYGLVPSEMAAGAATAAAHSSSTNMRLSLAPAGPGEPLRLHPAAAGVGRQPAAGHSAWALQRGGGGLQGPPVAAVDTMGMLNGGSGHSGPTLQQQQALAKVMAALTCATRQERQQHPQPQRTAGGLDHAATAAAPALNAYLQYTGMLPCTAAVEPTAITVPQMAACGAWPTMPAASGAAAVAMHASPIAAAGHVQAPASQQQQTQDGVLEVDEVLTLCEELLGEELLEGPEHGTAATALEELLDMLLHQSGPDSA